MSILGDGINAYELINKSVGEINLAFGFKITGTAEDGGDLARLAVLNLDENAAPLTLEANNVKINIPSSVESDWDRIDDNSNSLKNCWLRVPSYLKENNTAKIDFELTDDADKKWISFYNLKTRRSIKVYFEKDNNVWKYKIGKFNFFKKSKN